MTLLEDGDAPSKIRQGVTTEVLGEDSSAGPASGEARQAGFTRGRPDPVVDDAGRLLRRPGSRGIAPNVASYVGLGTLLECVMGDSLARPDASSSRR